ncbi:expressed unknown protein [Seminavis robusta]|uniref:Uncharacterized protein n=1 Tax=Seminavis robusta TaxID=568900 RepID=A0A9N8EBD3_9STRA|nr:expressed unknown protein [Seminavis robusta]|eukprot:Sro763_g198960.1 n/a (287) ;mRNA; r:39710-40570
MIKHQFNTLRPDHLLSSSLLLSLHTPLFHLNMALNALSPMYELMSAGITPGDLDFELDPDSKDTMHEFEVAWKKFMKDHPELVPEGKREKNIRNMQKLAKEVRKTQMEAANELLTQLGFFEKSIGVMEQGFEKELNEARNKQRETHENLQRQRDSIAVAEHLLSQVLPCDNFLSSLERLAEKAKEEDDSAAHEASSADNDKKVKPSLKALYLVDSTIGDSRDVQLRAYGIDHALLNTQVKMLQREAEGYEKLLETQKLIGNFLNGLNSSNSSAASRSVSTKSKQSA